MKTVSFIFMWSIVLVACVSKQQPPSKSNTHQIPAGIRAFIDDSLYTFDTAYTQLLTDIYPDSFQLDWDRRDTLYSVEVGGILPHNLQNYYNWTSKIRVSVGFKHHDITPGTYFHDNFGHGDTLCGFVFYNKCYEYYMPNELNRDYNVTILSIDSTSVQGTFVGQVRASSYNNPYDSSSLCKGASRPKEKFMIRGEFNVPVRKEIIIHKKGEPRD